MKNLWKRRIAGITAGLMAMACISTIVNAEDAETWNGINPDLNSDGSIDASDASYVLMYAAESGASNVGSFEEFMEKYFDGMGIVNPDLNSDGSIDASDASYILMYAAESGVSNVSSFAEFMEKYFGNDTEETADWWTLYADRIKSYGSDTDYQFAFIYLDDNDVPELLEFDKIYNAVITYVNGDSCATSENTYYLYGSGYYEKQDIIYYFGDAGGESLFVANLSGGELEEHWFRSNPISDSYGLTGEFDYYIDEVQVTETEYQQRRSTFIDEDADSNSLYSVNRMTYSEALAYLEGIAHQNEGFDNELALFEDILLNPQYYPEVWDIYDEDDAIAYSVIDLDGNGQYEMIIAEPGFLGSYTSVTVVLPTEDGICVSQPEDLLGNLTFFDNGVILADFSGSTVNRLALNITDLSAWFANTERDDTGEYVFYAYPYDLETGDVSLNEMLTGEEAQLKMADICSGTPLDVQFTEYDLSNPASFDALVVIDDLDEIRLTWDKVLLANLENMGGEDCKYALIYIDNDDIPEIYVYNPMNESAELYTYSYSNLMQYPVLYSDQLFETDMIFYVEKENIVFLGEPTSDADYDGIYSFYHLTAGSCVFEYSFLFTYESAYIDGEILTEEEFNDYMFEKYNQNNNLKEAIGVSYTEFLEQLKSTAATN